MISIRTPHLAILGGLLLASCSSNGDDREDTPENYDGIAAEETITLGGTEPFWSMVIEGDSLTYSTPENIEGEKIEIARFAGNNGLGLTGELGGAALQVAVTPGECSDGMSDRQYPFTATVTLGDQQIMGCGHTSSNPYTGDETE